MGIPFIQCSSTNYKAGRTSTIKYIVVHYTANNGDTAENNANYFANNEVEASAHYFVDENEVYQSVAETDTAWHCGATTYKHAECRNANSLGVELCSRKDSSGNYYFKDETVANAIELIKDLMTKHSIGVANVVRHYDVTGKNCPAPFVTNEGAWEAFKARLTKNEESEDDDMVRYQKLSDIPNEYGFKDVIEKLMNAGIINGDGSDPAGNDDVIDLSHDQVRSLIFEYRGGAFDRKLIAAGMDPAVKEE